jgi:hypothetical protein
VGGILAVFWLVLTAFCVGLDFGNLEKLSDILRDFGNLISATCLKRISATPFWLPKSPSPLTVLEYTTVENRQPSPRFHNIFYRNPDGAGFIGDAEEVFTEGTDIVGTEALKDKDIAGLSVDELFVFVVELKTQGDGLESGVGEVFDFAFNGERPDNGVAFHLRDIDNYPSCQFRAFFGSGLLFHTTPQGKKQSERHQQPSHGKSPPLQC